MGMLIGPNAPLVIETGCRASHMEHCWDFFKPHVDSPYPVVDGHYSNTCFIRAIDKCYERYCEKFKRRNGFGKLNSPIYILYLVYIYIYVRILIYIPVSIYQKKIIFANVQKPDDYVD